MNKSILFCSITVIITMMVATFIESVKGTPFVGEYVYGAWWFVVLWVLLTISSCIYIIRQKLHKRLPVFLLHLSLVVILVGALTSHLTSERGQIHLREGIENKQLGIPLELKRFEINYYPGTDAPMDYSSIITAEGEELSISMNNIGQHKGYRFYQSSYDSDLQGTLLSYSHDPWGIGITYTGYIMLLLSIIAVLFSRHTHMRHLYKVATGKRVEATILVLAMFLSANSIKAETRVPSRDICEKMGELSILYNQRICPVNTVAIDFTTKLTGKASWRGYSANEVFAGWTFFFNYWEDAPMFRIKDKQAQQLLGIKGEWASFNDFWTDQNEYKLQVPLEEAYLKGDKEQLKHLRDADEKFNIIRMFYSGEMLRVFPFTQKDGRMQWFSPGATNLPEGMPEKEWFFVRKSMDYMNEAVMLGNDARALSLIKKIHDYQMVRAKEVMPSAIATKAEIFYNKLNTQRWPVMLALACGFILFALATHPRSKAVGIGSTIYLSLLLFWLTVILALRWFVSGHLPLSNGYETMQFLAWSLLVITISLRRKFPIVLAFGPLLAAFALLVAMISGGNPQITQLMPVLNSPLLSVHVMVIMFAYSLFALMALVGLYSLCCLQRKNEELERLAALSLLMLYPAVFLLAIGIFIGAVWANVSWGNYWSWDSKEVWALITLMIYAAPLHQSSLPLFQKPRQVHIYMAIAFLAVLMTYFGVNYFLPGMHSYA